MSSHVPSDEVHSSLQWNAETVHLHTHDRQLVSHILVCQSAQMCAAPPSHFCLSVDSVRLVNEFNNMPVPSKTKQQGESSKSAPNGICYRFLSEIHYFVLLLLLLLTAVGDKVMKDIRPGVPFEPTYIYKLLTLIKSSLSEKVSSDV